MKKETGIAAIADICERIDVLKKLRLSLMDIYSIDPDPAPPVVAQKPISAIVDAIIQRKKPGPKPKALPSVNGQKTCKTCRAPKPVDAFSKGAWADGRDSMCKECRKKAKDALVGEVIEGAFPCRLCSLRWDTQKSLENHMAGAH